MLTDNERSILYVLAVGVMAERTGSDVSTAEDALNRYSLTLEGDNREVMLSAEGQVLVRVSRQWLAEAGGAA